MPWQMHEYEKTPIEMEEPMVRRSVYVAWLVACLVTAAQAEAEPPTPLPKEIVAAWKAAGAEVGWARLNWAGVMQVVAEKEGKPGDLPSFQFKNWQMGLLAKLPVPEPAFALELSGATVTDATLNEVGRLK